METYFNGETGGTRARGGGRGSGVFFFRRVQIHSVIYDMIYKLKPSRIITLIPLPLGTMSSTSHWHTRDITTPIAPYVFPTSIQNIIFTRYTLVLYDIVVVFFYCFLYLF